MTDAPDAGFLPVDKPTGPTSHDIVAAARRALRERRIGHTGTLDPFASGLLLLAIGRATRLVEYLSDLPKTYRAVLRLGQTTDTDDRTGTVLASTDAWRRLDASRIEAALASRVGVDRQVPPMYSARKVAGRRLYDMARKGLEVEREASAIVVHAVRLERVEGPDVAFEITCSTGTYVRAIARDVGNDLGVGAHLVELRRTAIGPHRVEHAVAAARLDDVTAVRRAWIAPVAAIAHLPTVEVDADQAAALAHGRAVAVSEDRVPGPAAAVHEGELIAVGELRAGSLLPRKVFA